MKHLLLVAVAAAGFATTLPAAAQFRNIDDAVKYRKAAFTLMGNHFNRIGAMVKGNAPYDAADAAANAEIVSTISRLPFHGFVEGSAGNGDKGTAKPNIWTERAKFDETAKKLQADTASLATAAKTNNLDNVKTAFGAAAKTCMSCHDSFRAK
jgi:cytochrome c556